MEIKLSTKKQLEFIDITSKINEFIEKSGTKDGTILVYTRHTTTGLTINENEAGLIKDMEQILTKIIPKNNYEHDRIDDNASSHLRSLLLEHNLILPISDNKLDMGTWQKIFLVELDGPRNRSIQVKII